MVLPFFVLVETNFLKCCFSISALPYTIANEKRMGGNSRGNVSLDG
jgi:hypothetical protein